MGNRASIEKRVIETAEKVLQQQNFVSAIDIFLGIGTLKPDCLQDWRKGRIPYLEKVIEGSLGKISFAMKCFRSWAIRKGLKPSKMAYLSKGRGSKKELRFSKTGNPQIEIAYRTHYFSPILAEKKRQRLRVADESSCDVF
jgi:hypothetical protein